MILYSSIIKIDNILYITISLMDEYILKLIVVVHFVFILFVVLTPFIGNNYFLVLHTMIIPFIMFHWYINDNTCALTLMEQTLRNKLYGEIAKPNACYSYKLIAPIYDFRKDNDDMYIPIYVTTIFLWFVSIFRLAKNYREGKLSKLEDLFLY